MKKIGSLILAMCLIVSLSGCQTEVSKIKKTLTNFQEACRELDIEGVVDCLDPDMPELKVLKAGGALASLLTGGEVDLSELGEIIFGSSDDMDELFESISVENPKCKIDGDTAVVTCTIVYEDGEESYEEEASIDMTKIEDEWYISGIDLGE